MPFKAALKLGDYLGRFFYRIFASRRRLVHENIRNAFPEKSQDWVSDIARKSFIRACWLGVEMVAKERLRNPKFFSKWTIFEGGEEEYAKTLRGGGIFIAAHLGSWEWHACAGAVLINQNLYPFARRQSNPWMNAYFEKSRSKMGMIPIYIDDSVKKGFSLLRKKQILIFAADQYAASGRLYLEFMNRPASTFLGPARFARISGAPTYFVSSYRNEKNQIVCRTEMVSKPTGIDPKKEADEWEKEFTKSWLRILENRIREHPEDYFWLHNRWKNPPPSWPNSSESKSE